MAKRKNPSDDEPKDNPGNVNESDDNFGLPDIAYEPLNRTEEQAQPVAETTREELPEQEAVREEITEQYDQEYDDASAHEEKHEEHIFNERREESSVGGKIIGILFLVLLIGAVIYFFAVYKPQKVAEEKARQEEQARLDEAKRQEAEALRLAALKREEDERRRADSLANLKPAIGTIETLSERTGRYYVIVASNVDDDLIMDYAHKMSQQGVSSKILPRYRSGIYYRISVADADTYEAAQAAADSLSETYPSGAWVMKY